ncbi:SRPBCC family protein [Pontibacter sp. H249]|uniref:SRPBCC family protein n=1 Tax=Pontibacter sp. H249 TaxID=3133420 RepID=UPI0030C18921
MKANIVHRRRLGKSGSLAIALLAGYVTALFVFRRAYKQWGASDEEVAKRLPGDELMAHASANHAVTIQAPVDAVWPWLVQIGQDRAGFYSYSFLENLVLADIHNANKVVPEWQHLKAGDTIRLGSKEVYGDITLLKVVALEKNHYFILKDWGTFILEPVDANTTRFLIRSHGQKENWFRQILLFLLFDPIHFLMERKMMLSIKKLAERSYRGHQI